MKENRNLTADDYREKGISIHKQLWDLNNLLRDDRVFKLDREFIKNWRWPSRVDGSLLDEYLDDCRRDILRCYVDREWESADASDDTSFLFAPIDRGDGFGMEKSWYKWRELKIIKQRIYKDKEPYCSDVDAINELSYKEEDFFRIFPF